MEPVLVAAVTIGGGLVLSSAVVAWSLARPGRRPRPEPAAPIDDAALRAGLRDLTQRLERLERRLAEADDERGAAHLAGLPESAAVAGRRHPEHPTTAPTPVGDVRTSKRRPRRPDLAAVVLEHAARGREPIEIAQLVGADVGEVELIVQLARAAGEAGAAAHGA